MVVRMWTGGRKGCGKCSGIYFIGNWNDVARSVDSFGKLAKMSGDRRRAAHTYQ